MMDLVVKYGFQVNKQGSMLCPFHKDTHPSLKVYEEIGKGYFCFTCNKGGSIIHFVQDYFKLSYIDALRKLDADFHLGILEEKEDVATARRYNGRSGLSRIFKKKKVYTLMELIELHCKYHNELKDLEPFSDRYCELQHKLSYICYSIECMEGG